MDPWKKILNEVVPIIVSEGMKLGKQIWTWSKNQKIENQSTVQKKLEVKLAEVVKLETTDLPPLQEEAPKKVKIENNIWDNILENLKDNYKIPNKRTTEIFEPMNIDTFSSIFISEPTMDSASTFVDPLFMETILSSLPSDYQLPNEQALQSIYEMNGNNYDHLFLNPPPTPKTFVEQEIWEEVMSKLPKNYFLPNDILEDVFKDISSAKYDQIFQNPPEAKHVFIDPELSKLNASLPNEYKLPNDKTMELIKKIQKETENELIAESTFHTAESLINNIFDKTLVQ
ncbi:hypothetical protein [Bacillus sp. B1-b2]|uniref:hypothetical protein n=1 Tax=Bacillus sp. B1-b2 TaxID=2653201 RepID=UPI00186977DF|nr:hypothetical protein [Bacillus sp. B1-b2]